MVIIRAIRSVTPPLSVIATFNFPGRVNHVIPGWEVAEVLLAGGLFRNQSCPNSTQSRWGHTPLRNNHWDQIQFCPEDKISPGRSTLRGRWSDVEALW